MRDMGGYERLRNSRNREMKNEVILVSKGVQDKSKGIGKGKNKNEKQ